MYQRGISGNLELIGDGQRTSGEIWIARNAPVRKFNIYFLGMKYPDFIK